MVASLRPKIKSPDTSAHVRACEAGEFLRDVAPGTRRARKVQGLRQRPRDALVISAVSRMKFAVWWWRKAFNRISPHFEFTVFVKKQQFLNSV